MTTVRIICDSCRAQIDSPLTSVAMFICRENPALNVIGYECSVHGLVSKPLTLDVFYKLQTAQLAKGEAQPPVIYFTQAEALREFSEHLDETLTQILAAS